MFSTLTVIRLPGRFRFRVRRFASLLRKGITVATHLLSARVNFRQKPLTIFRE